MQKVAKLKTTVDKHKLLQLNIFIGGWEQKVTTCNVIHTGSQNQLRECNFYPSFQVSIQ